ncbi:MAG: GNAT family N-acetyltransferase [Coriobacteriia bacterium]|nr:GNAT family N-acetyltransferase [Coriobacteriia bacterium]
MSARAVLRPAPAEELAALWPAARASNLFETFDEFERYRADGVWRVLMTSEGEAAVLGSWRPRSPICAIKGLWCDEGRVCDLVRDVMAVASAQGFERVLSPLVPKESAPVYERACMRLAETIVTFRLAEPSMIAEVRPGLVRPGSLADARAVLAVDRSAFDGFWRYDAETLGGYLGTERLAVAEVGGEVIGYTLSTVKGAVGTLGRLGVAERHRRRGVGTQLLAESVGWMTRQGARTVTLCTQEHNAGSRRLYARAGFREMPGRLVFLLSDPLTEDRRT